MKLSEKGLDLIKLFEGCKLTAYQCPAGIWTIGWGTTEPIQGKAICKGMTITQKQADQLLLDNLIQYEQGVTKAVKVKLNQNQFDALVSFTYNCGIQALQRSDLLIYVNQKDFLKAANEFERWNKANGVVLGGLIKRRKAEKELFLSTVNGTLDKALTNAIDTLVKNKVISNPDIWIGGTYSKQDVVCLLIKMGSSFGL